MTDIAPAFPSPPTSAIGSTDDLFASLDLPPARPTVVHQTISLPFEGLDRDLKLNVDAGPGCGGVVWIAGEVRRGIVWCLLTGSQKSDHG